METSWSPSSVWISRTPCVFRPIVEISVDRVRMIIPLPVMSITPSSPLMNLDPDDRAVPALGLDVDDALAAAALDRGTPRCGVRLP